ncbi:hypothetical protein FI667_g8226, partial [Globisporangium splendens]
MNTSSITIPALSAFGDPLLALGPAPEAVIGASSNSNGARWSLLEAHLRLVLRRSHGDIITDGRTVDVIVRRSAIVMHAKVRHPNNAAPESAVSMQQNIQRMQQGMRSRQEDLRRMRERMRRTQEVMKQQYFNVDVAISAMAVPLELRSPKLDNNYAQTPTEHNPALAIKRFSTGVPTLERNAGQPKAAGTVPQAVFSTKDDSKPGRRTRHKPAPRPMNTNIPPLAAPPLTVVLAIAPGIAAGTPLNQGDAFSSFEEVCQRVTQHPTMPSAVTEAHITEVLFRCNAVVTMHSQAQYPSTAAPRVPLNVQRPTDQLRREIRLLRRGMPIMRRELRQQMQLKYIRLRRHMRCQHNAIPL